MHQPVISILLFFTTALTFASTASANQLWGIAFGGPPTELLNVDHTTGNAEFAASIRMFGSGLAYDANRNLLYAADAADDVIFQFHPDEPDQLLEVAAGLNFSALAYDPHGDRLFAAVNTQESKTIHVVDLVTLDVTDLGDPNLGPIYALGWNTTNERLYAVAPGVDGFSGDGDLVRFDNSFDLTQQTLVGELHTQDIRNVQAMTYDPVGDRFLGSAANEPFRTLVEIDPYAGVGLPIGPHDFGNDSIHGLAFVAVPEPASLTLWATSAVLLLVVRRRPNGYRLAG